MADRLSASAVVVQHAHYFLFPLCLRISISLNFAGPPSLRKSSIHWHAYPWSGRSNNTRTKSAQDSCEKRSHELWNLFHVGFSTTFITGRPRNFLFTWFANIIGMLPIRRIYCRTTFANSAWIISAVFFFNTNFLLLVYVDTLMLANKNDWTSNDGT